MDYLNTFLFGIAVGLAFNFLLPVYFTRWRSKRGVMTINSGVEKNLATKNEVERLAREVEELKTRHKNSFDHEIAAAEFYDENGIE